MEDPFPTRSQNQNDALYELTIELRGVSKNEGGKP
jgi:hypothetical protein